MSEFVPDRPEWLDDEFLTTCIIISQKFDKELNLRIQNVALTYVVPKGENYMSVMYRVEVDYQLLDRIKEAGKESFVVKVAPDVHEMGKQLITLFDVETDMYVNVIAKMEEILENKGQSTRLICRYIHSIDKPKVIVLEDLKPQNFRTADRHNGMDLEHCKWVYSKLAKFNASGMCHFYSMSKEEISKYAKWSVDPEVDEMGMVPLQQSAMKSIIKEMVTHNGRYTKAIDFLTKYIALLDKTKYPFMNADTQIHSLSHSDFWVNNIMFQYKEDGSIAELIFVDLQISHYDSIANDFLLFFATSTTMEVRKNNYKKLQELYFNSLVSNLQLLGYKGHIPTKDEFEEELRRGVSYALFGLLFFLPAATLKHDKTMLSRDKSEGSSVNDVMHSIVKLHGDRDFLDKAIAFIDILQEDGFMDKSPQ